MERCRYGEERRVKRVRVRSSSYDEDDDDGKSSSLVSEESQSRKKQEISFPSVKAAMKEVDVEVAMKEVEVEVAMKEVEMEVSVKEMEVAMKEESREMVVWSQANSAKLALTTYALTLCEECARGDAADEMLLCDKCDRGFHMFCLSPILVTVPAGEWMCPLCSQSTTHREFQMVQKRIVDYFSVQKFLPQKPEKEEAMEVKRQRGRPSLGPRLLPYVPTTDIKRRLEQMASLAAALTSLSIGFSDSLNYTYAPRTANRAAHEKGGMREMHKEDKETLLRCKTMCKKGQWPPLLVTYDLRQGFVVEADENIKDMTFITEYTGEVDYMCCRHYDSGNSIMGLLFSSDPLKELVICPDRKGNIARFLSGINNHTEEGRSKQNVRCVRYSIDGEARVILIAMRDIVKGERLYYDYNAYYTEYPTQHFV